MTNPLRTGLFTTLREMGAAIEVLRRSATKAARTSPICGSGAARSRASTCRPSARRSMIDEYPILAVAAAFAEGTTRMRGLKELRVKESDRLAATAAMLRVNGVEVEIEGDDLIVHGKGRAPGGGMVATHMDHRIAMSALVMGLGSEQAGAVDDAAFIATSFPGFAELMRAAGRGLSHDHRDRRTGGVRQGHARQAARRALRLAPSRHRAALSRGGEGGARCRPSARRRGARRRGRARRSIRRASTRTRCKRHEVGEAASVVSAIPEVRAALFDFQREFAAAPPGAVLDGRDIGTVICPDAEVKIFVTAQPEVRARRRALELRGRGENADEADMLADILRRDERDRSRAAAPLMQAPDAHLLDTSALDIDAAFQAALALVGAARRTGRLNCGQACSWGRLRLYPQPSGPPQSSTWPPERAEGAINRPSRLEDQAPLRAPPRRAGP